MSEHQIINLLHEMMMVVMLIEPRLIIMIFMLWMPY